MRRPSIFYGWVMVVVAVVVGTIIYGTRYSFAVFYPPILAEFGWSRASTALIFSINLMVYGLSALVAGTLTDRFGAKRVLSLGAIILATGNVVSGLAAAVWHLYFSFGMLMAIGNAAAGFVPTTALLSNWFVRKRGMAFAIYNTCYGLCYLTPILSQYLLSQVGWRHAFTLLGILVLILVLPLVAILIRCSPQDMGLNPDGAATKVSDAQSQPSVPDEALIVDHRWVATPWTLARALRTRRLWMLFMWEFSFWGLFVAALIAHQVKFFEDIGYAPLFSASILGIYGIMYALGSLLGSISDRIGREPTLTLGCLAAFLATVLLFFLRDASNPWMLYVYAVLLGIGTGMVAPTFSASIADIFHGRAFGSILGFIMVGWGAGGFIGPWLVGYIHDVTGSYDLAFVLMLGFIAFGAVAAWLAAPRKVRLVPGKLSKA